MPGHVDNKLTVLGDPEEVRRFVKAAHGCRAVSGDPAEYQFPEISKPIHFNFHSLVPLPPEFGARPYGVNVPEGQNGYMMEAVAWGVKWGAYAPEGHKAIPRPTVDPGVATYYFRTAWLPPRDVFLPKVAAQFPTLSFLLSWAGEGVARGRQRWPAGQPSDGGEHPYNAADFPPYDKVREEEWGVACELVERFYLWTHDTWVGHEHAAAQGHPFSPDTDPQILADWVQEAGWDNHAAAIRRARPARVELLKNLAGSLHGV